LRHIPVKELNLLMERAV